MMWSHGPVMWVCVLAAMRAVQSSPECAVEARGAVEAGAACLEAAAARYGARIEVADGAVPTVFLSDPQTPLRAFAACREPVVIKGSSVRDWRGISRWSDADALGAALPTLQGAYVRDEAVDARELALSLSRSLAHDAGEGAARGVQLPPSDPPAETSGPRRQLADDPSGHEEEVMGIRDFFADAAERTLYYARWMGHTDLAPLRADAEPFDTLLLDDDGGKSAPHDERRYFRLGSAGCTSSLHYDEYHNAFVQVCAVRSKPRPARRPDAPRPRAADGREGLLAPPARVVGAHHVAPAGARSVPPVAAAAGVHVDGRAAGRGARARRGAPTGRRPHHTAVLVRTVRRGGVPRERS